VEAIAAATETGDGTNIIAGLAVGLKATAAPIVVIVAELQLAIAERLRRHAIDLAEPVAEIDELAALGAEREIRVLIAQRDGVTADRTGSLHHGRDDSSAVHLGARVFLDAQVRG